MNVCLELPFAEPYAVIVILPSVEIFVFSADGDKIQLEINSLETVSVKRTVSEF